MFILPGEIISSSFMLSAFMHFIPVYMLVFGLFYFYVWKNSLIFKVSNCGLEDGGFSFSNFFLKGKIFLL